jgi:hypothetical protein
MKGLGACQLGIDDMNGFMDCGINEWLLRKTVNIEVDFAVGNAHLI